MDGFKFQKLNGFYLCFILKVVVSAGHFEPFGAPQRHFRELKKVAPVAVATNYKNWFKPNIDCFKAW